MITGTPTAESVDVLPITGELLAGTTVQWSEIVPIASFGLWKVQALKAVLQTAQLPANWDSYGSAPPSTAVVRDAVRFVEGAPIEDLPVPYVVPLSGGGIQFEWISEHREVEAEIRPDGSLNLLRVENGEPVEEISTRLDDRMRFNSMLSWLVTT